MKKRISECSYYAFTSGSNSDLCISHFFLFNQLVCERFQLLTVLQNKQYTAGCHLACKYEVC